MLSTEAHHDACCMRDPLYSTNFIKKQVSYPLQGHFAGGLAFPHA